MQTVYSRKARDHAKYVVFQLIIPRGANIEREGCFANRQKRLQGNQERQLIRLLVLVISVLDVFNK